MPQPPRPGITGIRPHAQLIFCILVETGFPHLAQAGLQLLSSGNSPVSASQNGRITGMSHGAWPSTISIFLSFQKKKNRFFELTQVKNKENLNK